MGQSIICLQEIPRWTAGRVLRRSQYVVHSSRSKADEAANRDGFDCGFLVPGGLNPLVRDERYGRYWGGLVMAFGPSGFTLIISGHFIHKYRNDVDNMQGDFVEELQEETVQYWQHCRKRYGDDISIIIGFDASVTLPRNIAGRTGDALLNPLKSHTSWMQHRVLS